jgi:NTP pyrophosphatase (non-canonical NTP hydrolase)
MTFEEFHEQAYPRLPLPDGTHLLVYGLGLAEEAGEVAGKIKKLYRDKNGVIDDEFRFAIKKELGDVLFYVRNVANEVELTMQQAAISCLDKLDDREKRGVLQGEGDDR